MNKLTNRLPDALVGRLKQLFPPQYLYLDPEECWVYGYDNSGRQALPDAVVFPTTHQQVLELVGLCNQYTVALTVRGRGTGTTGATVPIQGGIVASMERMVKVIEFSPDNRYLLVEPGITNQAVQDVAAEAGFFWPPDPTSSAFCTIGGNLAYNSAGPRAVKYGTPRENTLGLRAVTGAGREIRVGVRTSKGVVGYDFTRLLIGSEGTLAIITEATLKMTPIPESKCTLRALYRSVAAAADAVSKIMSQPVIPCALELMDHQAIKMIRGYVATDLPEDVGALLMIEVDGPKAGMDDAVRQMKETASIEGIIEVSIAKTADQVAALWQSRKALSPALRKVAPHKINEDVVVPVTEIPALIQGLEGLSKKYQLAIVNFGHAGNGNIHVNLLLDSQEPDARKNAQACLDEVFSLVLKLNGTLSGEHGIGLEKRDYINRELDNNTLQLMHDIKSQFDPNNILNPGKIPAGS